MAQQTDVVIDGAGYMLAPGKYTRGQDGAPEGRTGRVVFRDFFGGQRRHLQLERDKVYSGLNVLPALNGQGVQPLGKLTTATHSVSNTAKPVRTKRIPYAIMRGNLYYARGTKIYKATSSTPWAAPIEVGTMSHSVQDMCIYAENGLLCALGDAADMYFHRPDLNSGQALLAGKKGYNVEAYAGFGVWNMADPAGRPSYVELVTGTGVDLRILDHPVIRFAVAGAYLYAVTRQNVYRYSGRVVEVSKPNPAYVNPTATPSEPTTITAHEWTGQFEPFSQHGVWSAPDDYRVFEGYGDDIFTWLSGRMMRFKPNGERAGWEDTGLSGKECLGGCVGGGYLVVSIISHDDQNELWAWDGSGWWQLVTKPSATTGNWVYPIPTAGGGNYDIIIHREGTDFLDGLQLQHRDSAYAFPSSGQIVTSMIDAAERDKDKSWRKIGAVFATPERTGNLTATTTVTLYLDYSTDGGATWTNAVPTGRTGNDANEQTFVLEKTLNVPVSSRFLQLRVRWGTVSDWAPVLVGLWAEFEILDSPSRRRRWSFDVIAADQTIDRDGATLTRTGRQLITELWAAWQDGSTVTFRDLDYDDTTTVHTARIVGISEKVQHPSDQGRWGDSVVSLVMVEV